LTFPKIDRHQAMPAPIASGMPLDRDRLARVLGRVLLTPPNRRSADQHFLLGFFLLGFDRLPLLADTPGALTPRQHVRAPELPGKKRPSLPPRSRLRGHFPSAYHEGVRSPD
jgi:hypothetical protein